MREILKSTRLRKWLDRSFLIMTSALLISLFIHAISFIQLSEFATKKHSNLATKHLKKDNYVRMKFSEPKPEPKKPKKDAKKILEARQKKTEAPKKADYLGQTDHIAKKQTKGKPRLVRPKAADPGKVPGKKGTSQKQAQIVKKKSTAPEPEVAKRPSKPKLRIGDAIPIVKLPKALAKKGLKQGSPNRPKPRNQYEELLNLSYQALEGEVDAGYQDYLDEDLEEGDIIDINTREYRFIGYFTNMRKAIELVWNYPMSAARRGIQGAVGLKFAIQKDGRATNVKVVESSGYEVLDNAIVEAITLASPFPPIPEGFQKKRMVVQGKFTYVLNSFVSSR